MRRAQAGDIEAMSRLADSRPESSPCVVCPYCPHTLHSPFVVNLAVCIKIAAYYMREGSFRSLLCRYGSSCVLAAAIEGALRRGRFARVLYIMAQRRPHADSWYLNHAPIAHALAFYPRLLRALLDKYEPENFADDPTMLAALIARNARSARMALCTHRRSLRFMHAALFQNFARRAARCQLRAIVGLQGSVAAALAHYGASVPRLPVPLARRPHATRRCP